MRMSELLNEVRRFELDEGFSPREIKMAIGIASDPRYAKGNMTGAVNAIEKMKKGLSDHPQVAAVLKRQNENVDLDEAKQPKISAVFTFDPDFDKKGGSSSKDIKKYGLKVDGVDKDSNGYMDVQVTGTMDQMVKMVAGMGTADEDTPAENPRMEISMRDFSDAEEKKLNTSKYSVMQSATPSKMNKYFSRSGIQDEVLSGSKNNLQLMILDVMPLGKAKKSFPDVFSEYVRESVKTEAVSMAQQAAIAISKKERGEKPKDKMDEEEFGEKFTKKDFRDNEDSNHHTENGVEIVNMYGTPAEKKLMAQIAKNHDKNRGISEKEQKLRDAMVKKYYSKLESVEIDEASRIVEPYRPEFGLDEAPKMTYALVGTDMKIYAIDSDEKNMKLNRRSLEKRFKDVSPLKIARLKTAQSIGDTVDKSQLKEETLGLDEISTFSRAHIAILKKTFDPMRDKRLGPKGQAKLSKIMDIIGDKKDALIDLFKADIPFVSQSAAAMLITKYNMKGDEINKLKEEVELDEAMPPFWKTLKKNRKLIDNELGNSGKENKAYVMFDAEDLDDLSTMDSERIFISLKKNKGVAYPEDDITAYFKTEKGAEQFVKDLGGSGSMYGRYGRLDINLTPLGRGIKKESIDEKYDLYHKDFSSAMQHAYSYAKSKMGITVDPKEIDSKVATGPKKPTEGKTNKYMLKGKGGNLQIQVYNKGGSKPFELNMYKEENNLISAAVGYLSND